METWLIRLRYTQMEQLIIIESQTKSNQQIQNSKINETNNQYNDGL